LKHWPVNEEASIFDTYQTTGLMLEALACRGTIFDTYQTTGLMLEGLRPEEPSIFDTYQTTGLIGFYMRVDAPKMLLF
jgi:hypothetical protein